MTPEIIWLVQVLTLATSSKVMTRGTVYASVSSLLPKFTTSFQPKSGKKWTDMKMSYFLTLLAEVCTGVAPEVNAGALARGNSMKMMPAPCLSSPLT